MDDGLLDFGLDSQCFTKDLCFPKYTLVDQQQFYLRPNWKENWGNKSWITADNGSPPRKQCISELRINIACRIAKQHNDFLNEILWGKSFCGSKFCRINNYNFDKNYMKYYEQLLFFIIDYELKSWSIAIKNDKVYLSHQWSWTLTVKEKINLAL